MTSGEHEQSRALSGEGSVWSVKWGLWNAECKVWGGKYEV